VLDETTDELCSPLSPSTKTPPKTLGQGVIVKQPDGPVGLCPAAQNSCTEFIDPDSRGNGNLVRDPALINLGLQTAWRAVTGGFEQTIKNVQTNALYIVGYLVNSPLGPMTVSADGIYYLDQQNNLIGPRTFVTVDNTSEEIYIYNPSEDRQDITITVPKVEGDIFVRPAIVDYKLANTLSTEVPTTADFVKGQILFNQRSQAGSSKQGLQYDTNLTYADQQGDLTGSGNNNANVLLQVAPDRECAEWLGCKVSMPNPLRPNEQICYQRGLCNQMDATGQCVNFLDASKVNQTYDEADNKFDIYNLSGYSKVGYANSKFAADYFPLADMEQRGDNTLSFEGNNGSFELNNDSGFLSNTNVQAPVFNEPNAIQAEGLTSFVAPDGQAIAKTNTCVSKVIGGVDDKEYIFSAYVYMRSGQTATIELGNSATLAADVPAGQPICPFVFGASQEGNTLGCDSSSPTWMQVSDVTTLGTGKWVRVTKKITVKTNYTNTNNQIRVRFCGDGALYFDDVRLEPGLEVRDGGAELQYTASSCRLYPKGDALSCDYFDNSNVRQKGWQGYCLEKDPRDNDICLQWYPLDKVASEAFEGGMALNFPNDVYYCIDAVDECNGGDPTLPNMFCKQFIKVNKNTYWRGRLSGDDNYILPSQILNGTDKYSLNFGVTDKNNLKNFNQITLATGLGLFGAFNTDQDLNGSKEKVMTGAAGKLSFLPYNGTLIKGTGYNPEYMNQCKATLDTNGHDRPIELFFGTSALGATDHWTELLPGTYDGCFVRAGTQIDCNVDDESQNGINKCCVWDYTANGGQGGCTNTTYHYSNCGGCDANFTCGLFRCGQRRNDDWCDLWGLGNRKWVAPDMGCKDYSVVPDVQCLVLPPNYKDNKSSTQFMGVTVDTFDDTDEVSCLFDCYNHIVDYKVAAAANGKSAKANAVDAIKRLWTGMSGCYTWNGKSYEFDNDCNNTYRTQFDVNKYNCANNKRDPKAAIPQDNCYVNPVVTNFRLASNDQYKVNDNATLTFVFNVVVDSEQLPFQHYTLDWGGPRDSAGNKIMPDVMSPKLNMDSRPDAKDPYYLTVYLDHDQALKGASSVSITPRITVTDNWGRTGSKILDQSININ
jgi:hypothetical protein